MMQAEFLFFIFPENGLLPELSGKPTAPLLASPMPEMRTASF